MVVINGQNVKDVTGISVLKVLNKSGYNINRIAVELNEKILPKSRDVVDYGRNDEKNIEESPQNIRYS